jgi:ketol-acid reductoisomerase
MTTIYYDGDANPSILDGQRIAVVGYGNQGRPWALNLRDSGRAVAVCVRADDSRARAREDGFDTCDLEGASEADVVCVLVPDDVIPSLPLERREDQLTIVASGYALAFERFGPPGDLTMLAPRMLGPEVRSCYEEGVGFITAVGVQRDATGQALARTLAVAHEIGGLRQGAIGLTPMQEAVLDLSVEQVLSPALTHVNASFVSVMLERGIPQEAILTELFFSGEVERNYRLLREQGFSQQLEHHSPTSQYGQLSRRGTFDTLDFKQSMRELVAHIENGHFADEWDRERDSGYRRLESLKDAHAGPGIREMEKNLHRLLGPRARRPVNES